jgi:drug/metabolite transporter (DMT)-like permease
MVLVLIWGLNFPIIKQALAEVDPLAFNALRFPLASAVVLLLLRASGPLARPERRDVPRILLLGFIGNVAYQLLFIFGLSRTGAGNASVLLATTPVWTAVLSSAAGHEKVRSTIWIAAAGTLAGMVLLVAGGDREIRLSSASLIGDLLMAASAFTWAVYTVGARTLIHRYGALPMTAWTLWTGTAALVLLGTPSLLALDIPELSPTSWFGIAYAGTLAIGVAYVLWNRSVRRVGNASTAIYGNLVPVVALGAAWIWLGEVPTGLQLAGTALILGFLLLARLRGGATAPPVRPLRQG